MYTRKQIMNAIENCLDESESKIIKTRFGTEDGITMSLNEIEIKLGVEREQVREIEIASPSAVPAIVCSFFAASQRLKASRGRSRSSMS